MQSRTCTITGNCLWHQAWSGAGEWTQSERLAQHGTVKPNVDRLACATRRAGSPRLLPQGATCNRGSDGDSTAPIRRLVAGFSVVVGIAATDDGGHRFPDNRTRMSRYFGPTEKPCHSAKARRCRGPGQEGTRRQRGSSLR